MDKRKGDSDSEGFHLQSLEELMRILDANSKELDTAIEKAKKVSRKQKHAYDAVTNTVKYLKDRQQRLQKAISMKKGET